MMEIFFYLLLISVIVLFYLLGIRRVTRKNRFVKQEEFDAGLIEPPSLHPIVDHSKCLGCGSCVLACHEKGCIGSN